MAVSSNRSPSPVSTRPNPNSRTPESNSTTRRSFSSNPFARPSVLTNPKSFNPITPANSPADFGRRHSTSKEGAVMSRGYEEKENEKDPNPKPVKVRSPAVVKSTKNFMSPTISAASKITAASPRKKVLTERNDPVRASVSFSDCKSPFSSVSLLDVSEDTEPKTEMGSNHKKIEASCDSTFPDSDQKEAVLGPHSISEALEKDAFINSQVPPSSLKASESLSETITIDYDCVSVDTSSKIKPSYSSVSPIIAPLDADPSLPPYDPKTNYLSPRPLFLRYKPNPRIEVYLKKEKGPGFGDGKRLEDSFMSENFSDTEVTEETLSEDSQKESEDACSAELIIEEEEPHVSEPKVISTPTSTNASKETAETKRVPKPQFYTRSKSISLLLVLLIACLSISVTDSPVIDLSVSKDLSFSKLYDPSEIAVFAKANFDGFARNFKQWSANSIAYLSKLIPNLGEVDKFGPLQFTNLTTLQEDLVVDGYVTVHHGEDIFEESYERDELEREREGEVQIEELEEKGQPEVEADDSSEEASEGHNEPEIEEVHVTTQAEAIMVADSSEAIQKQEESDSAFRINLELQSNLVFEDQSVLIPPATEIQTEVEVYEIKPEMVETGEFRSSDDKFGSTGPEANLESSSDIDAAYGGVQSSEALNFSLRGSEDKFSEHYTLGVSLLALAIVAASAFIYLKQGKTTISNAVVHIDPLFTKKLLSSPVLASSGHTDEDKPASQNWQTELDVVGESCPSEMSSFQKSSSYSKKGLNIANEAQSQERRPRKNSKRESLASSSGYSMGSPSYGSFTTYEKIPSKHGGCGDEETVTPVRRSSRIRNHVTSP